MIPEQLSSNLISSMICTREGICRTVKLYVIIIVTYLSVAGERHTLQ
jgi:hypothetical protein